MKNQNRNWSITTEYFLQLNVTTTSKRSSYKPTTSNSRSWFPGSRICQSHQNSTNTLASQFRWREIRSGMIVQCNVCWGVVVGYSSLSSYQLIIDPSTNPDDHGWRRFPVSVKHAWCHWEIKIQLNEVSGITINVILLGTGSTFVLVCFTVIATWTYSSLSAMT